MTLLLLVAAALAGCAHGDPMPPRAERSAAPASVKDHPGFALSNAHEANPPPRSAREPPPVCVRSCPSGQRCELIKAVETCVAD